jgi:hypothetical protein
MRRGMTIAGATFAICAVAVSSSGASAGNGNGDHVEFAVGSAKNRFAEVGGPNELMVAAVRHANGTVTGYARGSGEIFPGGTFQVAGEVTCLRVEPKLEGNGYRASVKYRFRSSSGSAAPPQGGGVEVFIEDNGPPRGGQPVDGNGTGPPMDQATFEATNPHECDDPNVAGQPYNPVDQGNYTIGRR